VGQEVEVRVDKHLGEDCPEPKGVKAFKGTGQCLGAPVPNITPEAGGSMPGSFPPASNSLAAPPPREIICLNSGGNLSQPLNVVWC
jgi:UBX domain-containing protein 1